MTDFHSMQGYHVKQHLLLSLALSSYLKIILYILLPYL